MVLDRPGGRAIGPAGGQKDNQEGGDQRPEERSGLHIPGGVLIAGAIRQKRGARPDRHEHPEGGDAKNCKACAAKPLALALGERPVLIPIILHVAAGIRLPFAEARLDDLVCNKPDDGQVDEEQGANEVPVARKVHRPASVDVAGAIGAFGDAKQKRVELARSDICRETAGHACERGCDPCERMTSRRCKDDGRERDHDDIACIGRMIGQHRDQRDERCQHGFRRTAHGGPNGAAEQAGALCHARAQHHDKHIAERVEMGECGRHLDPEPLDILRREKADSLFKLRRAIRILEAGMEGGNVKPCADLRDDHQRDDQVEEDEDRVWQLVARFLDPAEKTLLQARSALI